MSATAFGDRFESSRLTSVELDRFDKVLGPERYLEHLLRIHVEVTKRELVGPVRILIPPFEDWKGPPVGLKTCKSDCVSPGLATLRSDARCATPTPSSISSPAASAPVATSRRLLARLPLNFLP